MSLENILLSIGGGGSVAVAMLHLVVIYYGAPAYRYFGAGEAMAKMAEEGSPVPAVVTSAITVAFLVFAAYAFSAAGWLELPYPIVGAGLVAGLYTLRGIAVIPIFILVRKPSLFDIMSSLVSLAIGLIHVGGLYIATY